MEPVRYIDRTREEYLRQGYDKPYEWAHFEDAPFARLAKPLSECRVGLIGTSEIAVRYDPETEENPVVEEGFRGVYAFSASTPTDRLYSRTSSFDRHATHLDDVNAYYPVDRLREAAADGRIGGIPDRLYGCYNNYSQRKAMTEEAPKALDLCREDGLDALILVPV